MKLPHGHAHVTATIVGTNFGTCQTLAIFFFFFAKKVHRPKYAFAL